MEILLKFLAHPMTGPIATNLGVYLAKKSKTKVDDEILTALGLMKPEQPATKKAP